MRIPQTLTLLIWCLWSVCILAAAGGRGPTLPITVTLRGKRYEVNATNVSELQKEIKDAAGLSEDQQSVLFKGRLLNPDDDLEGAGVVAGDVINVVPSKRQRTEKVEASASAWGRINATRAHTVGQELEGNKGGSGGGLGGNGGRFGDLGGLGGGMGNFNMLPEQYEQVMNEMLNSPMMDEFFASEEKIEESRQAILENSALKEAMSQLPGFSDMIDDPEKWRESMMQAKDAMASQRELLKQKNQQQRGPSISGDVDDFED